MASFQDFSYFRVTDLASLEAGSFPKVYVNLVAIGFHLAKDFIAIVPQFCFDLVIDLGNFAQKIKTMGLKMAGFN